MTPQEIFDKALAHTVAQGHPARAPDGSCRYRMFNGDKCAVGALIDDETARAWDDIGGIEAVLEYYARPGVSQRYAPPGWVVANSALLVDIQSCHDSLDGDDFAELFIENMRNIAPGYNLTMPGLQQVRKQPEPNT